MATESKSRFRAMGWIAAVGCVVLVSIQFARPAIDNPPITAELQAPAEVKEVLRNACYNCHSNETRLWWFDRIAPASWFVARDVKQARAHLNFSEIGKLPAAQQRAALYEAVNQIQLGAMPLPAYLRVHPGGRVTEAQLAVLRQYLAPANAAEASPAIIKAADVQYKTWIQDGGAKPDVKPEPNGIAFLPDYKNWHAISSTDRFDNHTMRQILGNDIAVKAIAEHHINPWPDGTVFAKVAWLQQPDSQGVVHSGEFVQVEFMIRDRQKYASTEGWGWARWRGSDLKPYGKDAHFVNECIGCHTPVRQNDFVYTTPLKGQQ